MDEMSKKTLILLDFDGTIVDGDIAFTMLENTLNKEEYKSLTDFNKMNYAESMDKYYKTMKSKNKNIDDIHPILEGMKFIGVKGSAQRLAWSTLRQANINFSIEREVKSQFDAFKIVKNSEDYYTFLNASYFNGNEILKNETRHVISLVQCSDTKEDIYNLIEYLLFDGQIKIGEQGFIPMKPWKTR